MNETVYDLIDAIKDDRRYIQFKEQSLKLLDQETKELLENYQNLLKELDDLKKYEKYIDLSEKKQELNEIRKRRWQNGTRSKSKSMGGLCAFFKAGAENGKVFV